LELSQSRLFAATYLELPELSLISYVKPMENPSVKPMENLSFRAPDWDRVSSRCRDAKIEKFNMKTEFKNSN
jgi:hypothetical protein